MANGWAEFIESIWNRITEGRLDPSEVWSEFVRRSEASPLGRILQIFADLARPLPAWERTRLVMGIAGLLGPLEWPPEWEAERPRLVEGLESLLRAMNPNQPDSFPTLLGLAPEEQSTHATGYAVLQSTLNLLRPACRRDQLRVVARLCNIGQVTCQQAYRRALAGWRGAPMTGALLDARTRYVFSFEQYATAARALNSAAGEVLFEGLDARLEVPGA